MSDSRFLDYQILERATKSVLCRLGGFKPNVGLILGSGLSAVVKCFSRKDSLQYQDIPALGNPGVAGHAGELVWGELGGIKTLVFCGRRHWYEGLGWTPVSFPIFLLKSVGAVSVILTNAAGGIKEGCCPGTLMIINDHINFMGSSPLIGATHPVLGERFPDMTMPYDAALRSAFSSACVEVGERAEEGVLIATSGPSYETKAEISLFKNIGASAVGMSVVPETLLARAAKLRVLGVSCITNFAAGIATTELSHEEVTETTKGIVPRMAKILPRYFERLGGLL